jgi:hypothetical protein
MLTINTKTIKDGQEIIVTPAEPIPDGHKVRYTQGKFQAIPQNEEWPEDKAE